MTERFSIRKLASSFRHAWDGVAAVALRQHNARIHLAAAAAAVAAGVAFRISGVEWCLVVLAVAAVWSAEAMNTALEALADAVAPDPSPAVGHAKDIAAGAVLLTALGAAVVGTIVFGPRLLHLASA